jgi:uncharacterized membrane protein YcaP (DUF421 family)
VYFDLLPRAINPPFATNFACRRICGLNNCNADTRSKREPRELFSEMDSFYNLVGALLGLGAEPKDLTFMQISLRGIIVFIATLAMIRLGHKRSLARKTAFDAVLIVILASVLSRAINGSSAFFATLGGSIVIVVVHRLFAFIAYYSHWFGVLIKGTPELIIEDGDLILSVMRRNHVSKHDLEEDLRLEARTEDIKDIRHGYVERSGDISFIERKK